MALTLRLAALLVFSVALSFAGTWSGSLVDSKCYASEERNVNPTDTLTHVDRDGNEKIRFCSPALENKVLRRGAIRRAMPSVGFRRKCKSFRAHSEGRPETFLQRPDNRRDGRKGAQSGFDCNRVPALNDIKPQRWVLLFQRHRSVEDYVRVRSLPQLRSSGCQEFALNVVPWRSD